MPQLRACRDCPYSSRCRSPRPGRSPRALNAGASICLCPSPRVSRSSSMVRRGGQHERARAGSTRVVAPGDLEQELQRRLAASRPPRRVWGRTRAKRFAPCVSARCTLPGLIIIIVFTYEPRQWLLSRPNVKRIRQHCATYQRDNCRPTATTTVSMARKTRQACRSRSRHPPPTLEPTEAPATERARRLNRWLQPEEPCMRPKRPTEELGSDRGYPQPKSPRAPEAPAERAGARANGSEPSPPAAAIEPATETRTSRPRRRNGVRRRPAHRPSPATRPTTPPGATVTLTGYELGCRRGRPHRRQRHDRADAGSATSIVTASSYRQDHRRLPAADLFRVELRRHRDWANLGHGDDDVHRPVDRHLRPVLERRRRRIRDRRHRLSLDQRQPPGQQLDLPRGRRDGPAAVARRTSRRARTTP